MPSKIIVLNGFEAGDPGEARVLPLLQRAVGERGDVMRVVTARERRLGHCIGCFDCFVRTPGACIVRDEARQILEEVLDSDLVVFLGRTSFGGYSAGLKRLVDRILPVLLPYFSTVGGETHHPPRYPRFPRLVAVGLQQEPNEREQLVFRTLVGRNAINLHAPSHACLVIGPDQTDAEVIEGVRQLWERKEARPWREQVEALVSKPALEGASETDATPGRALLVVGSPKLGPSTSSVLGTYLLEGLRDRGQATRSITLKASLRSAAARRVLVDAVTEADVIVLAAPLYVDALHVLPTLALEVLAAHRAEWASLPPKSFAAIINCGFPEAHQNAVALAVCARFAAAAGMCWAGGLALGGGEAMSGGAPLTGSSRGARPPSGRVTRALDMAADSLAAGRAVPARAQLLFEKSPIPMVPSRLWHALYRFVGARGWETLASSHGLRPKELRRTPAKLAS